MRRLLNSLYIFTEDAYLTLDGENVVAKKDGAEVGRVPLHTLEGIHTFSYAGASPALMGKCAEQGISLAFYTPRGRFLADVGGAARGNVYLRRAQYEVSAAQGEASLSIAKNFIMAKIFNSRWILERACRDHEMRVDAPKLKAASGRLANSIDAVRACDSLDALRGIEGDAAAVYFSAFPELVLRDKEAFAFSCRVRRPPTDAVNSMLSFFYTVLANDCASALNGVGFDPYVGFLHVDRPGRKSLALDCMEELRPVFVDRFVLTAINNRVVTPSDFEQRETGEVLIADSGRKALFKLWQTRKKETITHPFLKEKMPRGMVPFVQAQLLAKCLRGDFDGYPPYFWK